MTKDKIEILFKAHYQKMYHLARTILYDEEESKDVVSEVFERLLNETVTLRPDTAERYLLTCVRNGCRNVLEHRVVKERFARLFSERMLQPFQDSDDSERLDGLLAYVDDYLLPLTQQIFRMRFVEDMTYQEIADALNVSKVTVYNHLSQSLERINAYFKSKQ